MGTNKHSWKEYFFFLQNLSYKQNKLLYIWYLIFDIWYLIIIYLIKKYHRHWFMTNIVTFSKKFHFNGLFDVLFLNICDWSVPLRASLEACYWIVAGQPLNVSHPKASVWQNPNITMFSGNFFLKTSNCHHSFNIRAFDLIQKLRARPQYQLSSGTKYTAWLALAFPPDRNQP